MGKTSKVVICGMKNVGKTAILEQLIYGTVNLKSCFYPTIEDIYVANIETDRGSKERVCFFDTAGLEPPLTGPPQSPTMQLTANQVLQRHYLGFAEGYVMVYDSTRPESLDVLMYLKKDIDRNKDKKEVVMLVIGNRTGPDDINCLENTCSKAANWCSREKIRHFEVSAMDRPSLYEPFIFMTTRLNPVQNKTAFPQLSTLSKLTQKNNRDARPKSEKLPTSVFPLEYNLGVYKFRVYEFFLENVLHPNPSSLTSVSWWLNAYASSIKKI